MSSFFTSCSTVWPRRRRRHELGLFPKASAMPTVRESQGLELLTVPQSHGSQGPSHSFKYKGRTNALKGTGGNARNSQTCTAVRRGITAVQKKRAGASGIQNRRAKIEGKKRWVAQFECSDSERILKLRSHLTDLLARFLLSFKPSSGLSQLTLAR